MKIGLFIQEITFIAEFPVSNLLLPTFLVGSKWDFPVANLLLATANFEPWVNSNISQEQNISDISNFYG